MLSTNYNFGKGLFLVGLFFVVLSAFAFGSHYYYAAVASFEGEGGGDSGGGSYSGGDSGSYSGGSYSGGSYSGSTGTYSGDGSYSGGAGTYSGGTYSGGTYSGSTGGTYSGYEGYSGGSYSGTSSGGTDSGGTGGTGTYSGGAPYTQGDTRTDASGNTWTYQGSGQWSSSSGETASSLGQTSSSVTNPDGSTTTTYSYFDPNSGRTYSSATVSVYDSATGATSYTTTYTDPASGETKTYTSYAQHYDPVYKTTSYTYNYQGKELKTETKVEADGSVEYKYEYVNAETGQVEQREYVSNYDKDLERVVYTYAGKDEQNDYRSEFDPKTGQYMTSTPTGEVYEYRVGAYKEAVYDPAKGEYLGSVEQGGNWAYNPLSGEYKYTKPDGTVETGVYTGPSGSKDGEVIIHKESGVAYTFNDDKWIEEKTQRILGNIERTKGSPLTEEERAKEEARVRSELSAYTANRYLAPSEDKSAYTQVVSKGMGIIGDVEKDVQDKYYENQQKFEQIKVGLESKYGKSFDQLTEEEKRPAFEAEMEADVHFEDYREFFEEKAGKPFDQLTEEEKQAIVLRYEEFKEEVKEETFTSAVDYSPETKSELESSQALLGEWNSIPEDKYETYFEYKTEYYSRTASGEDPGEVATDLASKWREEVGAVYVPTTPPVAEINYCGGSLCPPNLPSPVALERVEEEYEEKFDELDADDLPEDHPLRISLEQQLEVAKEEALEDQQKYIELYALSASGCGGEFGGSADSCSQKTELYKEVAQECGSDASCHEVAVQIIETPCESSGDSGACTSKVRENVENYLRVKDISTELRSAAAYEIEAYGIEPLAEEVYKEWESCTSSGGSGCDAKAREQFEEIGTKYREFENAKLEAMSEEEREAYLRDRVGNKDAFDGLVEPEIEERYFEIMQRFNNNEDPRVEKMQQLTDLIAENLIKIDTERGTDEIKDGIYYMGVYEQAYARAKYYAAHGDLDKMVEEWTFANDVAFPQYMAWATENAQKIS